MIPGAYLAEQLIGDVQRHQRATKAAVDRGELLEQVVASGHEVNRLGDHHLEALCEGARALGHDTSDVVLLHGNGLTRQTYYDMIAAARSWGLNKPIVCNED